MLGFTPKRVPEGSVKDVAVIDPTASAYVDPQTGALIEEKSKAERWFVARLDAVLLVFVCISQVIKYLDQQSEYSSSPLTFPPHPWQELGQVKRKWANTDFGIKIFLLRMYLV